MKKGTNGSWKTYCKIEKRRRKSWKTYCKWKKEKLDHEKPIVKLKADVGNLEKKKKPVVKWKSEKTAHRKPIVILKTTPHSKKAMWSSPGARISKFSMILNKKQWNLALGLEFQ